CEKIDTGRIAARSGEAGDKTQLDRIFWDTESNWKRLRRSFGRDRSSAPRRRNHSHLSADQIGRQFREPIESVARQAIFDRDILALDVAGFGETSTERIQEMPTRSELQGAEKSDHRHRLLLCAGQRPPHGCGAAKQRDELAASCMSRKEHCEG